MKASDLLVKCLENEGVEYIFGIPGEKLLTLWSHFRKYERFYMVIIHPLLSKVYDNVINCMQKCA